MSRIDQEPEVLKVVHTYGAGLHYAPGDLDVNDPAWQRRQVEDFVEFAVEAERLGFDGVSVTEHHAPLMVCPSPHLLLAAAAVRTDQIRLGTAVTVLPLYDPVRVAEEAGMLDLLSGGRFELGLGRGIPGEALVAIGRELSPEQLAQGWSESLDLLALALSGREFTFEGEFHRIVRPTRISTRPLQERLPVWLGASSLGTVAEAGRRGWNLMRNHGSNAVHRAAIEHYLQVAAEHGHARTGANVMLERFVAVGASDREAERNLRRMGERLERFVTLYVATGRSIPATDAEFHAAAGGSQAPLGGVDGAGKRPAIAVGGTPAEVVEVLQRALDETGARRLLVELFSAEERRVFMQEIVPALTVARPSAEVAPG